MQSLRKSLLLAACATVLLSSPLTIAAVSQPAAASEIKLVVNRTPITTYDIQRRAAFLRLQQRKGNVNEIAEQEMIEQALRVGEARRLGINVTPKMVDDAYARFAGGNKMSVAQLDSIMSQSGVTKAHFKEFILSQMMWGQALGARGRTAAKKMTEQEVVKRMMQQGGAKPTATEYMLQQIIFVVPKSERSNIAKRKREADAMRKRFAGCEQSRQFAKGLIDVTVRDLGRVFGPELPPEWAEQIKKTQIGGATEVRETDRGVEFIGICSTREVSDDRVAQMVFQAETLGNSAASEDETSKKYLAELREKARIKRN